MEPHYPMPDPPDADAWRDPDPPRCSECGSIVRLIPGPDGSWVGRCPEHGEVEPYYPDSQNLRNEEDDDDER